MLNSSYTAYTEQDTADKLILPYLETQFGFPARSSLDYQAQHTAQMDETHTGRYDGLYLSGGFPYAILEAKRYVHELEGSDLNQARSYATGGTFDSPVPFLIVSNGREHRFYKRTETIDPGDGKLLYEPIPPTLWKAIQEEAPGKVRRVLGEQELLSILLEFKRQASTDISASFTDPATGRFDKSRQPNLSGFLREVLDERRKFVGETSKDEQIKVRHAIEAISLHFTIKILFIKLIEDLSAGSETPRVIHTLFPRVEYDLIGGLFGFKVFNALSRLDKNHALRIFVKSKRFYRLMAQDLAKVSWQDIFQYGFNVHSSQYGKLFKAANYDQFLPSEDTLAAIRNRLISIDIRSAILYGDAEDRVNIIGHIYERLIDEELRNSIGAIYTPETTMRFMVDLGKKYLGGFRHNKIVEPSCGSGHFYRQIYREYVDEVTSLQQQQGLTHDPQSAHVEALQHIYGRDVDPFAVQLTLFGTFLEQLKDNVLPAKAKDGHAKQWTANRSIDTQNSLDPITIEPYQYFDVDKTHDLSAAISRRASCLRAHAPRLVIGNPPYGVDVVRGDHYSDIYDLVSKNSYGYFIVNALRRLKNGGRVIFIVSSSFLTIETHLKLRHFILDNARIIRIIKLSRQVFPGIDIFPVIIELERCSDPAARESTVYQFFDLWQLHPKDDEKELRRAYKAILEDDTSKNWPFPVTRTNRYTVRQGILRKFSQAPIFEGRPSLYDFMQDVFPSTPPEQITIVGRGERTYHINSNIVRGRTVVKLSDIADVKIGLQSGNNRRFYRAAAGVKGGAAKGGYKEVDKNTAIGEEQLRSLTSDQTKNGISVDDPSNEHYFVPLDKAAASNIKEGFLPVFWRPVEFYVNWSRIAVDEMKKLRAARFQNSHFYFKSGISYSTTGIYSPTFRLNHGGVFDQKSSCIFSDVFSTEALLALLSSTLIKYFVKTFINHGVDAQVNEVPIVLPTEAEIEALETKVGEIVLAQKANPAFDYREKLAELDSIVFDIYRITQEERLEIETWYKRHYPKLFNEVAPEA